MKILSSLVPVVVALGSVGAVGAQTIQTVNPSDPVSSGPTKLNYNFNLLYNGKVGRWSGAGVPGSIPLSVRGDIYINTLANTAYRCFKATACNAVAANNWQLIGAGSVSSVFGRTGAVAATSGDYTASQVTNVPAGGIAATDVQSAITELDTEKQATGNYITSLTGDGTATGPGAAALVLSTVNSNTGSCGDSTHVCQVTLNAKGLATAATAVAITGSAGTVTVVGGGSLTSTALVTGGGTTALQTPSALATLDTGGNLVATSVSTGASPPTCTGGTAGGVCYGEGTAITGVAGADIIYADSTAHRLKQLNNNGTADTVVGAATTDTLTNKTFDTAGTGNSFKINGTAVTAVSGTGGTVCLTVGSLCGGGAGNPQVLNTLLNGSTSCPTGYAAIQSYTIPSLADGDSVQVIAQIERTGTASTQNYDVEFEGTSLSDRGNFGALITTSALNQVWELVVTVTRVSSTSLTAVLQYDRGLLGGGAGTRGGAGGTFGAYFTGLSAFSSTPVIRFVGNGCTAPDTARVRSWTITKYTAVP
jgi:hypothetical protein